MPGIATSAPGKLFLMGEYAVLEGAPALLTAVDRRVHVRLNPSADDRWRISAPNLDIVACPLGTDGALPVDMNDTIKARLAVFDAVRATIQEEKDFPAAPLAIEIDAGEFAQDGHKLGLGSSAAVASALGLALAEYAGLSLPRERLAALAITAHRRAQNGTGSGGDVAVSAYGGVISYTQTRTPIPLIWPQSLDCLVVVTGTGASTVELVSRVKALRESDPPTYLADMGRLRELAGQAADALNDAFRFLQLGRAYFQALQTLDDHAGAGIVTDRHRELGAIAERHGGLFKSCGAGGGDIGLVFLHRGDREQALRQALAEAGAQVLPLAFGAAGARIETYPDNMR